MFKLINKMVNAECYKCLFCDELCDSYEEGGCFIDICTFDE